MGAAQRGLLLDRWRRFHSGPAATGGHAATPTTPAIPAPQHHAPPTLPLQPRRRPTPRARPPREAPPRGGRGRALRVRAGCASRGREGVGAGGGGRRRRGGGGGERGRRMLAAGAQVGCVLGKGGKTVERMRQESGAQISALQGDELIHWELFCSKESTSISFNLPPKIILGQIQVVSRAGRPFGPPGSGCPPGVDPHSQRSYLPADIPDYHARNFPGNVAAPGPRFFVEQEIMFRMICLNEMVGGIIGKGGATIRALQSETGASVKLIDPVPDSDERVIVTSARENSEVMHSPSQDALLRVYSRISEASMDKSSAVPARLLVPSQHIGCLLGKGGSIIAEMRKVTGASIRIFGNEQIPRCAKRNDELVFRSPAASNPSSMHCFISLEGLEMSPFPRSHILVEACLHIHLSGTHLITNQDKNKLHHITVEACLPILCILSDLILLWVLSPWQIIDHLDHLPRILWNISVLGNNRMVINEEILVLLLSSHHREPGVLRHQQLTLQEACLKWYQL